MDPITALTIASTLVNLGGNILSKPKKRKFSAAKLFPDIQRGVMQNVEAVTAPMRQAAGESAAARGLTGGAGAQVVAQAEAPVRAQAAGQLSDIWANLKMKEQEIQDEDRAARTQWLGGMFGDLAGGGAALASGMIQQRSDDRLLDILGGKYDQPIAQRSSNVGMRNTGVFGNIGRQTSQLGSVRQRNAGVKGSLGGTNAASFFPYRRRNLNNQHTKQTGFYNPLNMFGIGMGGGSGW